MNRLSNILLRSFKSFSTAPHNPSINILERLTKRTLIKVKGNDVVDFLQGLITNDMRHVSQGGSMYALFLNTKGRVLYDTIIYKTAEGNGFLIESDTNSIDQLQKHLKIYRLKKKVDITKMGDELDVYALYNTDNLVVKKESDYKKIVDGAIVPCDILAETFPKEARTVRVFKDLHIYRDPRMYMLGSRVICPRDIKIEEQIQEIYKLKTPDRHENYRWYRYNFGIGEGIEDLPPGSCFPLEANCDYLHGISFHKGCYIGQELTARTYHTGVTRKRLMPLFFDKIPTTTIQSENIAHKNVSLGKLRGVDGNVGLGLLRISQCLELNEIPVGDGIARTFKPVWWPVEAPKEKINKEMEIDPNVKIKEEPIEEKPNVKENKEDKKEINYFVCSICSLREAYDYFGMTPPFTTKYILMEDSFVLEDPFLPPRSGEYIVLGSICKKCYKPVCKDVECGVYFDGTYCIKCAKENISEIPKPLQEKINKITLDSR